MFYFKSLIFFTLVSFPCFADNNDQGAEVARYNYQDKFQRDTPRGTLEGFLKATSDQNYEAATTFLDLSFLPKNLRNERGQQIAKKLRFIIDRSLQIDEMSLSSASILATTN